MIMIHQTTGPKKRVALLSVGMIQQAWCRSTVTEFWFLSDGGGTRGLSSLFIIREILHRIKARDGLPELPLACDVFDFAGGTGTGGYAVLSFTGD